MKREPIIEQPIPGGDLTSQQHALEALRVAAKVPPLSPEAVARVQHAVAAKLAAGGLLGTAGVLAAIAGTVLVVGTGAWWLRHERTPISTPVDAPTPVDTLSEESALLRQAMVALRHEKNPRATLQLLADHRARFPAGQLLPEALVVRLEAHLDLGELDPAAELLAASDSGAWSPRMQALAVRHAELLLANGRAREALDRFEVMLPSISSQAFGEQLLIGKVTALAQLGQRRRASAAAEDYLRAYPTGRFASRARQWVSGRR